MLIEVEGVNNAFIKAVEILFCSPDFFCSPRGYQTKERLGVVIRIRNPYNRIVTNKYRKISLKYLVGEWLRYERGSDSLEEISYYSKFWKNISDDGKTVNSCYGKRILGTHPFVSKNQWIYVKNVLKKDIQSRRAIIFISMVQDHILDTKDVPCTMYLQFFIRENKLYLVSNMRSNDLIFGLTYDMPSFTLFQEKMLMELKDDYPTLEMGEYIHFAGSLHYYLHQETMIESVLQNSKDNEAIIMPKMKNLSDIEVLQRNEERIRKNSNEELESLTDQFCIWCQNILLNK